MRKLPYAVRQNWVIKKLNWYTSGHMHRNIMNLILAGGYFRYFSNTTHPSQTILRGLFFEYIFRPHGLSVENSNVLSLSNTHFQLLDFQICRQICFCENGIFLENNYIFHVASIEMPMDVFDTYEKGSSCDATSATHAKSLRQYRRCLFSTKRAPNGTISTCSYLDLRTCCRRAT